MYPVLFKGFSRVYIVCQSHLPLLHQMASLARSDRKETRSRNTELQYDQDLAKYDEDKICK